VGSARDAAAHLGAVATSHGTHTAPLQAQPGSRPTHAIPVLRSDRYPAAGDAVLPPSRSRWLRA
jgi:hypothetical protein